MTDLTPTSEPLVVLPEETSTTSIQLPKATKRRAISKSKEILPVKYLQSEDPITISEGHSKVKRKKTENDIVKKSKPQEPLLNIPSKGNEGKSTSSNKVMSTVIDTQPIIESLEGSIILSRVQNKEKAKKVKVSSKKKAETPVKDSQSALELPKLIPDAVAKPSRKTKKGTATSKKIKSPQPQTENSSVASAPTKTNRRRAILVTKTVEHSQPSSKLDEPLPEVPTSEVEVQTNAKAKRGKQNIKTTTVSHDSHSVSELLEPLSEDPTINEMVKPSTKRKKGKVSSKEIEMPQQEDPLLEMPPTVASAPTKTNRRRAILVPKTVEHSQPS